MRTHDQYFIVYRFVSTRKKLVEIGQTRFLSTLFLRIEFKFKRIFILEQIFTGKMFAAIFICGNLFFIIIIIIIIKLMFTLADMSQIKTAKVVCRH